MTDGLKLTWCSPAGIVLSAPMMKTRVMVVPSVLELLSTMVMPAKGRETRIWLIFSPPLAVKTTVAVVVPPRAMVAPAGETAADAVGVPN